MCVSSKSFARPGVHGLLFVLVPLIQRAGDLRMVPMGAGLDPPNEGRMSRQGDKGFC